MSSKTSWSVAVGWIDSEGEAKRKTDVINSQELMDALVQVIEDLDIEDSDIVSFVEGWEKGNKDLEETYTNIQLSTEYGFLKQKTDVRSILKKYN